MKSCFKDWSQSTFFSVVVSLGSIMRTKHLCVLIHISVKGDVGAVKHTCVSPPVMFLLIVPRGYFFYGSFLLFMFKCVLIILSCLYLAAL